MKNVLITLMCLISLSAISQVETFIIKSLKYKETDNKYTGNDNQVILDTVKKQIKFITTAVKTYNIEKIEKKEFIIEEQNNSENDSEFTVTYYSCSNKTIFINKSEIDGYTVFGISYMDDTGKNRIMGPFLYYTIKNN